MKSLIKAVVVLVIGGTAYTLSQADIVDNFSKETGLSKQAAETYIKNIPEDELVSFDKLGAELISDGQEVLKLASSIDCVNYTYDWESSIMTCSLGKSQLTKYANDEIALGRAYKKLETSEASENDIAVAIKSIETLNADYQLAIITSVLDPRTINEIRTRNSYNKALLQTALDSR